MEPAAALWEELVLSPHPWGGVGVAPGALGFHSADEAEAACETGLVWLLGLSAWGHSRGRGYSAGRWREMQGGEEHGVLPGVCDGSSSSQDLGGSESWWPVAREQCLPGPRRLLSHWEPERSPCCSGRVNTRGAGSSRARRSVRCCQAVAIIMETQYPDHGPHGRSSWV